MAKFEKHVFVCINDRGKGDKRGDCSSKGGHDVMDAFKKKLHERGLKRVVRPNKALCLDQCELGCTVVVYPDAVWYGHVKESDVDEIIDAHILGGKPVERLVIPDDELTGVEMTDEIAREAKHGKKKCSSTVDSAALDEESKGILRRIVERTAYRQFMAANIRGHGLKYVPEIDEKRQLARDIDASLSAAGPIEALYVRIGGTELTYAVRELMERIPYPYSRLELAVCLALVDRTERLVAESYVESRSNEMAALARSLLDLDRTGTRRLEERLAEFTSEPGNRPTAQQFLNRWLAIAIVAFGRPNSPGDQRAVALGLRSRGASAMVKRFLDELKPFVESIGLTLPALESLGVEFKA